MKLVLGVLDVAYSDASGTGATTTGDVAEILEARYHVMETFFELRREKIAAILADSMASHIQNLVSGGFAKRADPSASLTYEGDQKIETEFRAFLSANEMGQLMAKFGGVLSAAALAGVNHRKKNPNAKTNKARPAFIDSGLYQTSMRAWSEK